MAWDTPNDVAAAIAPTTTMTALNRVILAAITARRCGTAAKVVRIIPVEYSPTIVMAPTLPAASMMKRYACSGKASRRGLNSARRSAE
jgi:hypothetical protein